MAAARLRHPVRDGARCITHTPLCSVHCRFAQGQLLKDQIVQLTVEFYAYIDVYLKQNFPNLPPV